MNATLTPELDALVNVARAAAGLRRSTAFRAFLTTELRSDVSQVIGKLTDADRAEVQTRLRIALAVT